MNPLGPRDAGVTNTKPGLQIGRQVIVPLLLFLLAFAVRWPKLFEIPKFHGNELEITLQLVHHERFPFINQHAHIGALSNYIHAIGFWLLGMHFWVPGIITVIMGSLTVTLTYLLGKRLTDTRVAILGALLMSVSVYHVYFISHVPWSNCLTPFFVLLFLITFFKALEEMKVGWLILAAFVFGLALQTHPSVLTLFPAIVIFFLLQGRERLKEWFRKSSFYLLIPAVALGYANILYYQIATGLGAVETQLEKSNKYALEENPGVSSYIVNTGRAWTLLMRLVSAQVETKARIQHWENPVLILSFIFLFAGLAFCFRRKEIQLPVLLFSSMLLLPAFNRAYGFCNFGRYMGFLIPIALLLLAYALTEIFRYLEGRLPPWQTTLLCVWIISAGAFMAYHIYQLIRVYEALRTRDTSEIFLDTRTLLEKYDRANTAVLFDAFSWQSLQIKPFLESDGWTAKKLTGTETLVMKKRNFSEFTFEDLPQQVKELEAGGKDNVIVLASPIILKPLVLHANLLSFEGCLSTGTPNRPNNIYSVFLNNIYYVFRLSPSTVDNDDATLAVFRKIAPFVPDDLDRALPGNRHGAALRNPKLPRRIWRNFRAILARSCQTIPESSSVNSRICELEPQ